MQSGWTIHETHLERKLSKATGDKKRRIIPANVSEEPRICKFLRDDYPVTRYDDIKVQDFVDSTQKSKDKDILIKVYHRSKQELCAAKLSIDASVVAENERGVLIDEMRRYFDDIMTKYRISRPREALNRWIMEWKTHFDMKKISLEEPLLPCRVDYLSPLLQRELEKQMLKRSSGFTEKRAEENAQEIVHKLTHRCEEMAKKLILMTQQTSDETVHVTINESKSAVQIIHLLLTHEILPEHFAKLRLLFVNANPEEDDNTVFPKRLYTMLQRYRNATGFRPGEGCGHHCATPPSVLQFLHETIGVKMECFASPLNCYFPFYCSMFADTDVFFGSCGSFFSFYPTEGSFEAGPPYVEEVMEATRAHICHLLTKSSKPLSFVIIIPEWRDYPTECITKMDSNAEGHVKRMISISKFEHVYLDGFQHCTREKYFKPVHDTLVVIMQNDAGAKKWPANDILEARLRSAWKGAAEGVKDNPLFHVKKAS